MRLFKRPKFKPGDRVVFTGDTGYLGRWTEPGAPGVVEGKGPHGLVLVRTTLPDCEHNQTLSFEPENLEHVR